MFNQPFTDYAILGQYLSEQFAKFNVKVNLAGDTKVGLYFKPMEKRLFLSTKTNRIPLKPGDARIKELGRDYLESTRVTEKQHEAIVKLLTHGLNEIGLSCTIRYYEFENDTNSFIDLRKDVCDSVDAWTKLTPNSYPVESV